MVWLLVQPPTPKRKFEMSWLYELGMLILLALLNGAFAMAEMAVVSARKLRLVTLSEHGEKRAKHVLKFLQEPEVFFSTVQIGITLVGVGTGVFGGATLVQHIADQVSQIAVLAPYAETLGAGIVILIITYLTLVLGELVPKQIALSNPERYAIVVSSPVERLSRLMKPLVGFLSSSTQWVIKLIGIDLTSEPDLTEADIREAIDQASLTGLVTRREETMLESVLNLSKIRVETLFTPRAQVVWLDLNASAQEIREVLTKNHFDRYPVVENKFDQVVGVVRANKLLEQQLLTGKFNLSDILEPPIFIPESTDIFTTITLMQQHARGILFVLNEFGGIDGIVTNKDILEHITGDMPEFGDTYDPQIIHREDGSLLLAGMLHVSIFLDLTNKTKLFKTLGGRYQTLGGLVMGELGKIPTTGDILDWEGLRVEVVDMDGKRVDKVIVTIIANTEQ